MSNYIRSRGPSVFFFTVVTHMRQPILCLDDSVSALEDSIVEVRKERPFETKALVVLPDHMHCIWELPEGDTDYSVRWALIKIGFTKRMKGRLKTPQSSLSRTRHREAAVWQRRFWEHEIRDEDDFRAHFDYIHYNPVKHGLVTSPRDWAYSTFNRFLESGVYTEDWGSEAVRFNEAVGRE
ncbi:MAG: transposase [Deltaproteobacteria bacterium]|nr:transposase [Deltaproteobacteria bacterium]